MTGLHIAPELVLDPDYTAGGTFALLAKLRSTGLIEYPAAGHVVASQALFFPSGSDR